MEQELTDLTKDIFGITKYFVFSIFSDYGKRI